jgi:uncharacterized Fe-S cluster protein YjdI/CDGSH-type Zn-finger protein
VTKRTYESDAIRVFWDSERCIHTAFCLRSEPEVFDVERRPWVDIDAADADAVAAAIEECPSGALRYERLDGQRGEQPPAETVIVPWPNGPLVVKGNVRVETRRGEVFAHEHRVALCRCGTSRNQPFCDNSHREAGFRDNPKVVSDQRDKAASPSDVGQEQAGPAEV